MTVSEENVEGGGHIHQCLQLYKHEYGVDVSESFV